MNRSILGLAVTALLMMTAPTGFAAEATHVPATALAEANANLIARANRALRGYVTALSRDDDEAVARILTTDAVVEYALEMPGTYLAVEAAALSANSLVGGEQPASGAHISTLWIFPTPDSNVVFVQFTIASDVRSPVSGSEHLAVLEMRGDRIRKLRNFKNLEDAQALHGGDYLSKLEASVLARATHSARTNAHE